jgi:predicted O-methyltransferase YrrM
VDAQLPQALRSLAAPEGEAIVAARARTEGVSVPPSPEVGALLAWIAATVSARSGVEVGSAGGVSGLWLLRELRDRGALTSIEPDPHTHGLSTEAYAAAGASSRIRSILGDPAAVLPRLADGSYDLVLLQLESGSSPDDLEHAHRLLRAGGVLVARGVTRRGDHAESRARFLHQLLEDESFATAVLPLDDGLALATRIVVSGS